MREQLNLIGGSGSIILGGGKGVIQTEKLEIILQMSLEGEVEFTRQTKQ